MENQKSKIKNQNCGIKLFLLGVTASIYSLFRPEDPVGDMKKMEFSSSSQRLGVSFTEKIRNIFRCRWIKRN